MRLTIWIAMLVALSGAFSSGATRIQPSSIVPLAIESADLLPMVADGRVPRQIAVRIRNTGSRTIVAWQVWTTIMYSDGTTRRTGEAMDGYETSVTKPPNNPVLAPGADFTLRGRVPEVQNAEPISATALASFAVLDDDTVIGDNARVDSIFRNRANNERVWQALEQILDDAATSSIDARARLELTQASLESIQDGDIRNSSAYSEVRQRLGWILRGSQNGSIQELAAALRTEARARRELASAHKARR